MAEHPRVADARRMLTAIRMPPEQRNERSALVLLALLDLPPDKGWLEASAPLVGITPVMDWARDHYGKAWKPNTRETIRRRTMHQFVSSGIALYNPDDPERPVNSPWAVYQITPEALALARSLGAASWAARLDAFLAGRATLSARYAAERDVRLVPVRLADGEALRLSAGKHSAFIKAVVEEFAPRFVPGAELVYVGDTGKKWGLFDRRRLAELGVTVDSHGKIPDVVLHDQKRGWLVLVESVTSHGPVDAKRHEELAALFASARPGLVYVTAFPTRAAMARRLASIAWETEVWCADAPSHLIHFDGQRFLGPYPNAPTGDADDP